METLPEIFRRASSEFHSERKGKGISETVSIYRIAYGSAMERVILIHSPRVGKIEVVKRGKVRRGKLYHLRGVFGKKAKIQERITKVEKQKAAPIVKEEAPEKPEAKEEALEKPEKPEAKEKAPEKPEKPEAKEKTPEKPEKPEAKEE